MVLEIKFVGGLGNQLFQYATARRLCIKNDIPFILFNTESYNGDYLNRNCGIIHYNIKKSYINSAFFKMIFIKFNRYGNFFTYFKLFKSIKEKSLLLENLDNKTGYFTTIVGYWQSEFYFKDIREILLKELLPTHLPDLPKWALELSTVAIHVRRTDYLNDPRYGTLEVNYYENAIEFMKKKVNNPLFVFFSDDLQWCKSTFRGNNYMFCDNKDWAEDYLQLHLMSICTHQIIANSSFSWWGAWLNSNKSKIVIRPATPFKDINLLYEEYYPTEWVSICN